MLVNTKARIGVFSIALGAYLPQFPSLVPEFEAQYEAFKKTLPDTVDVIDGPTRTLFNTNSLQGSTVIIFFNTGCKDCQRELPELNAYYLRHRDEPGFRMVAIAREESEESISAYWLEHGLSIPYSPQTDRRIYNLFATSIIPRIYFCSDGIVTRIDVEKFAI